MFPVQLVIVGPIVAFLCSLPALACQTRTARSQWYGPWLLWGITVAECFGLAFILRPLLDVTAFVTAIALVITLAIFFNGDPRFRNLVLGMRARVLLALKVFVYGPSALDDDDESEVCCKPQQ